VGEHKDEQFLQVLRRSRDFADGVLTYPHLGGLVVLLLCVIHHGVCCVILGHGRCASQLSLRKHFNSSQVLRRYV